MITAIAGSSLSGCAAFNKSSVWPGDRTFVQFMVTPIGELLRGAPDEDVQFANETETEIELAEAETVKEIKTVKTVETSEAMSRNDALTWDDVVVDYIDEPSLKTDSKMTSTTSISTQTVETRSQPLVETVSMETTSRVLSEEEVRALLRRSSATQANASTLALAGARSSSYSSTPSTKTVSVTETRTTKAGSLKEGLSQADLQSMLRHSGGIETKYKQSEYVGRASTQPKTTTKTTTSSSYSSASSMSGSASMSSSMSSSMSGSSSASGANFLSIGNDISFVRMGGGASLMDWRACEAKTGSYWSFDDETHIGTLNPAFEQCMTAQNYEVETSIKTEVIQPTSAPVTVTTQSTLP